MTSVDSKKKKSKESLPKENKEDMSFEIFLKDYYPASKGKMFIKKLWSVDGLTRYRVNWYKEDNIVLSGFFRHRESDNKVWLVEKTSSTELN